MTKSNSAMIHMLRKGFIWLRRYMKPQSNSIYPAGWLEAGYTWWIKKRFLAWGKHSYIAPPATLCNPHRIDIGANVFIREHAWLNASDTRSDQCPALVIGAGTYIGRFVHINAYQDVRIEPNVLLADRVFITDVDHCYTDSTRPIIAQGTEFQGPVCLHSGCWIGIGAVILPDVAVGHNAVVAANAVVTRNVPARTVVGGIPAHVIKRID